MPPFTPLLPSPTPFRDMRTSYVFALGSLAIYLLVPNSPPSSTHSQAILPVIIIYALHRTKLHPSITFAALVLLQRLKACFSTTRSSSGHRLFISAFMITSKVICDDTYRTNPGRSSLKTCSTSAKSTKWRARCVLTSNGSSLSTTSSSLTFRPWSSAISGALAPTRPTPYTWSRRRRVRTTPRRPASGGGATIPSPLVPHPTPARAQSRLSVSDTRPHPNRFCPYLPRARQVFPPLPPTPALPPPPPSCTLNTRATPTTTRPLPRGHRQPPRPPRPSRRRRPLTVRPPQCSIRLLHAA